MIERTCKFCHKLLIKYVCRKHEKTVHQEKGLVECEHCPKKYTNRTSLIRHLHSEHSILPKCESYHCNITFNNFKLYTEHRSKRHGIPWENPWKKLPCDICKKKISRANISTHIRDVHNITNKNIDTAPESKTLTYPFGCPHCKESFKRKDHLINHTESQHGSPTKKIKCEKCGLSLGLA